MITLELYNFLLWFGVKNVHGGIKPLNGSTPPLFFMFKCEPYIIYIRKSLVLIISWEKIITSISCPPKYWEKN